MLQKRSRQARAAASALLLSVSSVRLGTLVKWACYVAVPVVPTMVELADWPRWVAVPLVGLRFHVIYWWGILVAVLGLVEIGSAGRRRVEWLEYWQERSRILAGNLEEIGQLLLRRRLGGGRLSTPDRIVAGILQQVVDVVSDLTKPATGSHVMACMLVPVTDGAGANGGVVALQATTYNQNAGRNKSLIPIDAPGPACDAFRTNRVAVVPDTTVEPYRAQFQGRPYRSVLAFPVSVGGEGGQKLAVLTVDSTVASFFTDEIVSEKGIEAAIQPYLKLIALTRIAEIRGGRHGR